MRITRTVLPTSARYKRLEPGLVEATTADDLRFTIAQDDHTMPERRTRLFEPTDGAPDNPYVRRYLANEF